VQGWTILDIYLSLFFYKDCFISQESFSHVILIFLTLKSKCCATRLTPPFYGLEIATFFRPFLQQLVPLR
jgi:hypothetical protein